MPDNLENLQKSNSLHIVSLKHITLFPLINDRNHVIR